MGFDNFLNTVRVLVQQKLGDSCEVRPEKVLKNNGTVCEGLTIISGSCPIAPTIYLNDFYEMYNCGMPIHRIADQVNVFVNLEAHNLPTRMDASISAAGARRLDRSA